MTNRIVCIHSLTAHGVVGLKAFLARWGEAALPVPSLLLTGPGNMPGCRRFEYDFAAMLDGTLAAVAARAERVVVFVGYLANAGQVAVVEAALDRLRHRDRARVRERAEIAARAGDDVGDQADIRRRQTQQLGFKPQRVQIGLAHVGQHQILFMRHAQFAEAVTVGEIGHGIHLGRGRIAGRDAGLLQRQRYRGVARHFVREDIALVPVAESGTCPGNWSGW